MNRAGAWPSYVLAAGLAIVWTFVLVPWSFIVGRGAVFQHGEMAWQLAGWWAYRDAPWRLPLLYVDTLNAPEGISVAFLDSIPVAAIFFKSLAAVLPPGFHYYGLWHLLAFVAQAASAVFLIRSVGHRSFAASALAAIWAMTFPALTSRFGHTALLSQAYLVAALALYYRCMTGAASLRGSLLWFAALLMLSLLTHPYLLAMLGILYGALLLDLYLVRPRVDRARLVVLATGTVAVIAVLLWPLGFLGAETGTSGFGYFSMNALAPFSKDLAVIDATGGQYEGFNYLGAGVLLGLLLTLGLHGRWAARLLWRFRALALAFVGLTLMALSNRIYVGDVRLVQVMLPGAIEHTLGMFRSSGRMFWPVGYALMFLAMVGVLRLGRRAVGLVVLAVLTVAQVVDVFGVTAPMRAQSRQPELDHRVYREMIARTDGVMFHPIFECATSDWNLLRILQAIAAQAGKPINTVVAARSVADCDRKADAYFEPPAARTLYVSHDSAALLAPSLRPMIDAGSCRQHDAAVFCVPGSDADWWRPLEPAMSRLSYDSLPRLRPGQELDFTSTARFPAAAVTGFALPEPAGSWIDGRRAAIYFLKEATGIDRPLAAAILLAGFVVPPRHGSVEFDVTVDQRVVGTYRLTDPGTREIVVDLEGGAARAPDGVIEIGIVPRNPVSPASIGLGRDRRALGVRVQRIRIVATGRG